MVLLNYDYKASKKYCESIGLTWLGDDFLEDADDEAKALEFTQAQVDAAMRHHLWQVRFLFTPQSYGYGQRILLALYFLFGWMPKKSKEPAINLDDEDITIIGGRFR